jgi:hypothetical protein
MTSRSASISTTDSTLTYKSEGHKRQCFGSLNFIVDLSGLNRIPIAGRNYHSD